MKKFVSIVIALVMVLSMTSAFALNNCTNPNFVWDCEVDPTDCGKGSIEVIPYVKVNTSCDGWEWQVSDCATAINTENVYYAVKLTVEENADPAWWANAVLTFEYDGIDVDGIFDLRHTGLNNLVTTDDEEQVWYLLGANAQTWINEEDDAFDIGRVVWTAEVEEADSAEFCATLASEHDGTEALWSFGDYFVWVDVNEGGFDYVITFADAANFANADNLIEMTVDDGEIIDVNTFGASKAFYNAVNADFNLNACVIGTCINADNLQANFGWDDEQEDCFAWSDKGAAVVNPECVVDIPKTGDVSVVAYAVMAIVAAAGTMLKK